MGQFIFAYFGNLHHAAQRKPRKNSKIGVFGHFNDYNDSSRVLRPDK
jgi:hypothetical protein